MARTRRSRMAMSPVRANAAAIGVPLYTQQLLGRTAILNRSAASAPPQETCTASPTGSGNAGAVQSPPPFSGSPEIEMRAKAHHQRFGPTRAKTLNQIASFPVLVMQTLIRCGRGPCWHE
jgi:hypothetical protein